MNPITIPNISIPTIGIPTIGIPSVGFPSASGGGLAWPAGMKEHIKAIYDPKKQGLTNYDVIEAYTEDFKKWNNSPEKYTGSLTSNSLALTNVSQKTALIYSPIKPYDFKVLIRGLQEGQHVKFGFDYGEHILEADKDGVYTLEWKEGLISYGIYTNFVGECNITITQLPTSILKDLSGNGNHAYLYGGKGKLNSGMGIYEVDFTTYYGVLINQHTCKLTYDHKNFGIAYNKLTKDVEPYTVKVTGIRKETVRFTYRNEEGIEKDIHIKNDGYYTVPKCYKDGTQGSSTTFVLYANYDNDTEVIIEQIPDYPNQLCYDGKMYAVCYGFPILEDYTVMADRTWFDKMNRACFLSKITTSGTGAFGFEFYNEYNKDTTYSFGRTNDVEQFKDGITWQITNSYNGIVKLDYIVNGKDNAELYIGKLRPTEHSGYVGCHGKIIIADRSFTEEEINWLRIIGKRYEKVTVAISCITGNRLCGGLVSPARAFAGRNTYRDKDTDGC